MLGFVVEALPDTAQQSLAQYSSDAPPMSADLTQAVVRDAFGRDPDHLFLDWQPAAAVSGRCTERSARQARWR
ncbi:MAG: hypothetical protein R2713_18755 [Ilumatobacteraceae bacterium]